MSPELTANPLEFDPSRLSTAREILELLGAAPNKTLGQNFLVNSGALDKIASTAGLTKDDAILEIGPGLGALICALIARWLAASSPSKKTRNSPRFWSANSRRNRFGSFTGDALDIAWEDRWHCPTNARSWRTCPTRFPSRCCAAFTKSGARICRSATLAGAARSRAAHDRAEPGTREYGPLSIMAHLYSRYQTRFRHRARLVYAAARSDFERDSRAVFGNARPGIARRKTVLGRGARRVFAAPQNAGQHHETARFQRKISPGLGKATGIDPMRRGETLSIRRIRRAHRCFERRSGAQRFVHRGGARCNARRRIETGNFADAISSCAPPPKSTCRSTLISRRADGYHELRSVVHTVGWHDEIELQLTRDDARFA